MSTTNAFRIKYRNTANNTDSTESSPWVIICETMKDVAEQLISVVGLDKTKAAGIHEWASETPFACLEIQHVARVHTRGTTPPLDANAIRATLLTKLM